MENPHRIDVEVLAKFEFTGEIKPLAIKLKDGRRIKLDSHNIDSKGYPSSSRKAGGQGLRFDRSINGKAIVLFYDDCTNVWFCEV